MRRTIIGLIGIAGIWSGSAAAEPFKLSLPVDCQIGKSCFIQQYMDVDPGPGARDYRCGSAVYNKHTGTDIRVLTIDDAKRGVEVLAAARGKVLRTRNSIPDKIVTTKSDRNAIQGVFCGNGLIIDHGAGWQTQYCHLRRGSVRVEPGDLVERGTPLGLVGYSGLAQFPHLHLTVYKDKAKVDPFTGMPAKGACNLDRSNNLWDEATNTQLRYREGQVLSSGFAPGRVSPASLLQRLPDNRSIASNSPALVAYGWWINLQKGDRVFTRMSGPNGIRAKNTSKPLNRDKAQYVQFAGKKRPADGWPVGRYISEVAIIRNGTRILEQRKTLDLR